VTRFPGGLPALHLAEDSGVVWLDKAKHTIPKER